MIKDKFSLEEKLDVKEIAIGKEEGKIINNDKTATVISFLIL